MKPLDAMHGVLGQTLQWARDGSGPSHVEGGMLVGNDADFEVREGLLGTAFNHSTLFVEGGSTLGVSRRSLRRMSSWVESPTVDDGWVEASAPPLLEAHSELLAR